MKKILTVATFLAATSAYADSIDIGYRYDNQRESENTNENISLGYKKSLNKNLDLDLAISMTERQTDGRKTDRYMIGLTPKFDNFSLSLRAGKRYQTNQESSDFYVIEPAYKLPITDKLDGRIAYRYRESFDSDIDDLQKGPRLGIDYKLDKKIKINLRYDLFTNSQGRETDRYGISLTRQF